MRKLATLALIFALYPFCAIAGPPAIGVSYDFVDPNFSSGQTVLCHTAEQIAEIAHAAAPNDTFVHYLQTPDDTNAPNCVAMPFTATVTSVLSLGVMHFGKDAFNAWDIGVESGSGHGAHALYLELIKEIPA